MISTIGRAPIVYLIKLEAPIGSNKHAASYYLGSTKRFKRRIAEHRNGRGSALLKAATDRGIGWRVVQTYCCDSIHQARYLERRLKQQKSAARIHGKDWGQYLY